MLHDDLKKLNRYPFHMPGHKRNSSFDLFKAAASKEWRVKICLLLDGFFSFAVVRQIAYFNFAF